MQRCQVGRSLAVLTLFVWVASAAGQVQPPSDRLIVDADTASTWTSAGPQAGQYADVIQLQGPLTIRLDRAVLSAQSAVIWLSPDQGPVLPQQKAEIALIGNAEIREPSMGITRSGDQLFITVAVRGQIRVTANQRLTSDQSGSNVFKQAEALRAAATSAAAPSPNGPLEPYGSAGEQRPHYRPTTGPARVAAMFRYHLSRAQSITDADGNIALIGADALIVRTTPEGNELELRADKAVIFTHQRAGSGFENLGRSGDLSDKIADAYLEGDVRINYAPAAAGQSDPKKYAPDQRLFAQRVYYDFDTDQAILTDAVLRTSMPDTDIPVTIRAEKLRQLSNDEFSGQKVELSTSSFATPTYSIKTDQVYVRAQTVISPYTGKPESQETFVASGVSPNFMDVPFFYLPQASGSVDEDPFPLRTLDISDSKRMGTGIATETGLYELLGQPHPPGLDLSFLTDFFSRRGPATGLNAKYSGSSVDPDSDALSDFNGQLKSFIITDHGTDQFGGDRTDVEPPDQIRGKFLLEHQQFFTDNWQAQIRLGYVSDPTFMEEYYQKEFYDNQQYDAVGYLKHQQDTEAITLEASADTNRFVTTSDQLPDQFDVEKLPAVGYRRIGDSLADDTMTFYSDNSYDRLLFAKDKYSLAQQGFVGFTPGIPDEGYTGTLSSPVERGDTRQELDYPIQLGQIKMVPFAVGRGTSYSNTPQGDELGRVYGAAGVRFVTDFWKVDDSVQSDLFDLSRVRHIIEPEVNLYTSGETLDRSHFFIYEQSVDGISDVSAADFTLHQRWETYRGAPGRQESVDFLELNVSADAYTNPPKDAGLLPDSFRGLYFPSSPETSIPRDDINDDVKWLVSDSTAIVADSQYNVDHGELATGSVGIATQRYDRLAYYLGLRYIDPLDSDIGTFAVQYALTSKYDIEFSQGYDFGQNQTVETDFTLRRKFDRLTTEFTVFHDSSDGDSGVKFTIYPTGLGPSRSEPDIGSFFNQ